VRVISKPAILKFAERHRDALVPLLNWYRITKRADWASLADVRGDFSHPDVVGRRTVFNIHGNDYGLIARVNYKTNACSFCMSLPMSSTAKETGNEIKDSVYAKLLAKTLPRPIQSEAEHARLTEMLLQLDERENLSPEEEAFAEVVTLLIEDYEEKYHPLPRVSPNESLRALMEDRGLKHKDNWPILGNKGAAAEVLSGRRSISKAQAKRLGEFFHVPIDLFV
jgi:HTH-type transcriptional regulator / antitoxin HigA